MKKVCYLFAVAVLLLSATWSPADARENPFDYQEVFRDSGEDHPWGGGSELDPTGDPSLTSAGSYYIVTEFVTLDMFLWKLFAPLIIDSSTRPTTTYEIVPVTDISIPDQPAVNENNRSRK